MLTYSELKKGTKIILDDEPYEIIEANFLFKGRGHSVLQAKLENLITGNVISRTFHPSDSFEEAEISKIKAKFLYSHPNRPRPFSQKSGANGASRDRYYFCEKENPAKRFDLTAEQIGKSTQFLKPNQIVEGITFKDKIINIALPVKIQLKVTEAPPGVKAGRAEAGTKTVTLETGTKINVPLFIKEGDIIEVNTEKGEYVRRIE